MAGENITENTVLIYSDGACSNNPGVGGWGAVLLWNEHEKRIYGGAKSTTNNRMEMMAAINSLKTVKQNAKTYKIKLYTDSVYLRDGITKWIIKWQETHWKNGKVKNIDLWKELYELNSAMDIEWYWVKGHSGNVYNEMADKLARQAIVELRG